MKDSLPGWLMLSRICFGVCGGVRLHLALRGCLDPSLIVLCQVSAGVDARFSLNASEILLDKSPPFLPLSSSANFGGKHEKNAAGAGSGRRSHFAFR